MSYPSTAPKDTDSDNVLLFKIAQKLDSGVLPSAGSITIEEAGIVAVKVA
jgi:hypothetical protein